LKREHNLRARTKPRWKILIAEPSEQRSDFHAPGYLAALERNGAADRLSKGHEIAIRKDGTCHRVGIRPGLAGCLQGLCRRSAHRLTRRLQVLQKRLRQVRHASLLHQAVSTFRPICARSCSLCASK